jgi:hypothetical protein
MVSTMSGTVDSPRENEEATAGVVSAEEPPASPRRPRRVLRRVLKGIGVTALALIALGLLLYYFGSMWTPTAEVRQAYAEGVAAGRVPPIEQSFHIPIPGCVCHSPDPVQQMQHESRRIKDCRSPGCHGG